jgi:hypothetical protein
MIFKGYWATHWVLDKPFLLTGKSAGSSPGRMDDGYLNTPDTVVSLPTNSVAILDSF